MVTDFVRFTCTLQHVKVQFCGAGADLLLLLFADTEYTYKKNHRKYIRKGKGRCFSLGDSIKIFAPQTAATTFAFSSVFIHRL